jgi:hypothetical protein
MCVCIYIYIHTAAFVTNVQRENMIWNSILIASEYQLRAFLLYKTDFFFFFGMYVNYLTVFIL